MRSILCTEKSHFRHQQFPGHHFLACQFCHRKQQAMWFLCSVVEVGGTQMQVNLPIPTCQKQLSSNAVPFPSRTHSAFHGHIFCNTKNRSGKYTKREYTKDASAGECTILMSISRKTSTYHQLKLQYLKRFIQGSYFILKH